MIINDPGANPSIRKIDPYDHSGRNSYLVRNEVGKRPINTGEIGENVDGVQEIWSLGSAHVF